MKKALVAATIAAFRAPTAPAPAGTLRDRLQIY